MQGDFPLVTTQVSDLAYAPAAAQDDGPHPALYRRMAASDAEFMTANNGEWLVSDNRLCLKLPSGEMIPASAMDVFDAAFRRKTLIGGIEVNSPISSLPSLTFSRVPALPAVKLSGRSATELQCAVGVSAGNAFAAAQENIDQCIVGSRWFPIDTGALSDVFAWLRLKGITPGVPLTIRDLIVLRQKSEIQFQLFDEIGSVLAEDTEGASQGSAGITATLYPYQTSGVSFLKLVSDQSLGCLLADEMGLGKTLQVIALLAREQKEGRSGSLIVAPATLLENWRREIERFAPQIRVLVHAGPHRAGVPEILQAFDVVVTSYDLVTRDELLFSNVAWNVVALDEAQSIKNPLSQRAASAKRLPRRVSIAVSGTPVENRLEDLWSLSDFCLPGLLGDLDSFRGTYQDTTDDARALGAVVNPIVLRRLVADVARDLPELIEIPQPIVMSARLAAAYEEKRLQAFSGGGANHLAVASALRQLCGHPSLIMPWDDDPGAEMPKYERLIEILEEIFAAREKVIVFTAYRSLIDLMIGDFVARWPRGFFQPIDGRTPIHERQESVDAFSAFEGYGTLVLNPKAAGTGLNITAANHVIHFTPDWNPAVTAQASARAYRRKQERPVTVHHLYFASTIEEAMVNRAAFKRDLATSAVEGHQGDVAMPELLSALSKSPLEPQVVRA